METIQKISGFPEYLPTQQQDFQKIIQKIQKIFENFCALPIETPAVERLENLLKKGGNPKEIYTLGRLGENQKSALGLKFDLTVPLARYVVQHFEKLQFPFRRYQMQPVWRGERAQKGRYRQFYQCDFDVIGNEKLSIYYDAEALMIITKIMEELQLQNYRICFNHRIVLKGVLRYFGASLENLEILFRLLDKKDKIPPEIFKEELTKYISKNRLQEFEELFTGKNTEQNFTKLLKISENIADNEEYSHAIRQTQMIYRLAIDSGISSNQLLWDLSIVRGLEYYTGIVFETTLLDYQELGSVCSGGRYDNLASYFGKRELPGVGFSIGLSRLFDVLQQISDSQENIQPVQNKLLFVFLEHRELAGGSSYVTGANEKILATIFAMANKLRKIGIPTEVFLECKKILLQIQYAKKKNYRWIAFYGEQEAKKNVLTVKDLQSKQQQEVVLQELENYFSRI